MQRIYVAVAACMFSLALVHAASAGQSSAGSPAGSSATPPTLGGCNVFPADNIWNTPVDNMPLDPHSTQYIAALGPATGLHPDFGAGEWEGGPIGIPYVVAPPGQAKVAIHYTAYGDESDPGPFPIPRDAPIEGGASSGGDRHVLVVDAGACVLYELFAAYPQSDGSWNAASGAVFDLKSNKLRTAGWTSADAAGLPILPGLVRYDEVAAGEIRHAIRFTVSNSRAGYVWPARHDAPYHTQTNSPPMGQRFRLKASFDISSFSPPVQVILRAMKKYGVIVADNGSNWYIGGAPDERWNNDMLVQELRRVKGSDFEAVDTSALQAAANSAQASSAEPIPFTNWLYLPSVEHRVPTGGTIP